MDRIYFSKKADKELGKLPQSAKKKVVRKIKVLQKQSPAAQKLTGKLKNLFSIRAWPYRIIYEVDKKGNLNIISIIHRQQAYKS